MSPRLSQLRAILTDAADGEDTEALTLARLRASGHTACPRSVTDAVAAIHALRNLADGACVHLATEGAAPGVDRRALAVEEQERRLDEAVSVLSRKPPVAA